MRKISPLTFKALREWYWMNFKAGAMTFGTASSIAVYEEDLVKRYGLVSEEELREAITTTQILPGPFFGNIANYFAFNFLPWHAALTSCLVAMLPGSVFAVLFCQFFDVSNFIVKKLLEGFLLGNISVALLILLKFGTGMRPVSKQPSNRGQLKLILRWVISILCLVAALLKSPLPGILAIGSILSLVVEFLI